MAILPRYKRMKRRDWKDPFSWFNWHQQNKRDPVFLYRPESGRTGMIGFTNTRADSTTCAMQRGSNGIWSTVAANVLRDAHYHYDGTSQYRTLLREGAGTNSALGACSFADGTYWAGNADFTLSAVTSCISGQSAVRGVAVGAAKLRSQNIGTFVNGQTDCMSFIVENDATVPTTITDIVIRDFSAGANLTYASLTWATKSIAVTSGIGSAGVIDLGTGPNGGALLRIYVTGTGTGAGTGAAGNTRIIRIYPAADTKAITIHHAQFEAATSYPSSPIVTVAAAVTRAADLISVAWPYAPAACTIYVDAYDLMGPTSATIVGQLIGVAPRYFQLYKTSTLWTTIAFMGSGSSISQAATATAVGNRVELRQVFTVSGANVTAKLGQSINSAAEVVAAAGTAQTLDATFGGSTMYVGSGSAGGNAANLAIRSICIVLGSEQSMATMREIVRQ